MEHLKHSLWVIPFLFIPLIFSCEGTKHTESATSHSRLPAPVPEPSSEQSNLPKTPLVLRDTDPYFMETQAAVSHWGPKSISRNIIQDRKGNFWMATWEGIIQYDGKQFTNFMNKEGLKRYHTFSVFEDSQGGLWFGTIGAGLYFYDGNTFTNLTTDDGLIGNQVTWISEDTQGKIWIGTDSGISIYKDDKFSSISTEDGLLDNDTNVVLEDRKGNFWIGSRGQASFYDGTTFKGLSHEDMPFVNVRSMVQDDEGYIWLGGNNGLWVCDGRTYKQVNSHFTGYIYKDSKNNIWTSSTPNLMNWTLTQHKGHPFDNHQILSEKIHLQDGQLFGIIEDTSGHIWYGTEMGYCRFDGENHDCFRE